MTGTSLLIDMQRAGWIFRRVVKINGQVRPDANAPTEWTVLGLERWVPWREAVAIHREETRQNADALVR